MTFACQAEDSWCVKYNEPYKVEHHRHFIWCCKVNFKTNFSCLETKQDKLYSHTFKYLNYKGNYLADFNTCPFWRYCFNKESYFKKYQELQNSRNMSQTSFSLYLHNQWTNFHKLSCTVKLQMRIIYTYVGCTKVTTNNQDIRSSVTIKSLFANISWMTGQIHMIKLVLESAHQTIPNDIWYII